MNHQYLPPLNLREKTILDRLARGWEYQHITKELEISEAFLKAQIGAILAKLQARTLIQAVAIAILNQMILPDAGEPSEFKLDGFNSRWRTPSKMP